MVYRWRSLRLETDILGNRAVEIAAQHTTVYDFANGSAATGQTTLHEIVFSYSGSEYICKLEAYPEIHSKWVTAFREFCHHVQAG